MIVCPICLKPSGTYFREKGDPGAMEEFDYPLYQRTYVIGSQAGLITCHIMEKGETPISPRCSQCYEEAVALSKHGPSKKGRK